MFVIIFSKVMTIICVYFPQSCMFDCGINSVYLPQTARILDVSAKIASNSRRSSFVCLFSVQPLTELSFQQTLVLSVMFFQSFSFPISSLYIHRVKHIFSPVSSQCKD